ncbi:MAG: hypothetical protein WCE21_05825 [Candidatus Babeliales bacterium]
MKKPVIVFIAVQGILLLTQIHKHSSFVQHSFALQRTEKAKQELVHKKNKLLQALHEKTNLSTIEKEALAHGMQKARLKNIKQVHT